MMVDLIFCYRGAFQAIEKTVIISVQPPVGETLSKPMTYTLRAATVQTS